MSHAWLRKSLRRVGSSNSSWQSVLTLTATLCNRLFVTRDALLRMDLKTCVFTIVGNFWADMAMCWEKRDFDEKLMIIKRCCTHVSYMHASKLQKLFGNARTHTILYIETEKFLSVCFQFIFFIFAQLPLWQVWQVCILKHKSFKLQFVITSKSVENGQELYDGLMLINRWSFADCKNEEFTFLTIGGNEVDKWWHMGHNINTLWKYYN